MDEEDDFFAYQTAKSLNSKRSRLKQFLQAPPTAVQSKSKDEDSSSADSDFGDELFDSKKSKRPLVKIVPPSILTSNPLPPHPSPPFAPKSHDSIRTEIDAIVTSCFATNNKTNDKTKRKMQLIKRTAADDQYFEEEDEREYYGDNHTTQKKSSRMPNLSRAMLARQHVPMEADDDNVTRETAAYDRLDAVLRVTKPLCEKQIDSNDDEEDEIEETVKSKSALSPTKSFDTITLKVDHSDGRQLTLTLPALIKLSTLHIEVAKRLSLPSVRLVHNNHTLKLDDDGGKSLKQLHFSSNQIELLESYSVTRKIKVER